MDGQIKVHVVKFGDRPNLMMRYVDPISGKQVARSTGTSRKRDAERVAAKWEAELREGRYNKPSRLEWAEFVERYTRERLETLAPRTLLAAETAFNHLERIVGPKLLASVTSDVMSRFSASMIDEGMKPTTLASHQRPLRAAFNWAVRMGLMDKAPRIDKPKSAAGIDRSMRGRPITGEEFDRMLAKVPEVRKLEPEKWERLLQGLWLSGLRLGEALQLSWEADAPITVNLEGKHPKLRIWAAAQKSKRDALLPIAPEFGEFLLAVPEAERVGLVFGIEGRIPGEPLDVQVASRMVSRIGKRAGVVVAQDGGRIKLDKKTGLKVAGPKFAGAHDCRRAFGTRWSKRVMPAVLKQLMRHASIDTTMSYYVAHNADDVAADCGPVLVTLQVTVAWKRASPSVFRSRSRGGKSLSCNDFLEVLPHGLEP